MKCVQTVILTVFLAVGLVGCGDDDGDNNSNDAGVNQNDAGTNDNDAGTNNNDAGTGPLVLRDLDGFYEVTRFDIFDPGGDLSLTRAETTMTLDGSTVSAMVRGHMEFTASNDASGVVDLKVGVAVNRVLELFLSDNAQSVSWEQGANKLVLGDPGDEPWVFLVDYDGTVLTLTLDVNDVRNQGSLADGPKEFVLTRVTPTATELSASWSYTSLTMSSGTITNVCTAASSDWERLSGTATFNANGYYTAQLLMFTFDNSNCSGSPTDTSGGEYVGFVDVDETNKELLMLQYDAGEDTGAGVLYDYTLVGSTLTLTLDTNYGDSQGADEVVLEQL